MVSQARLGTHLLLVGLLLLVVKDLLQSGHHLFTGLWEGRFNLGELTPPVRHAVTAHHRDALDLIVRQGI